MSAETQAMAGRWSSPAGALAPAASCTSSGITMARRPPRAAAVPDVIGARENALGPAGLPDAQIEQIEEMRERLSALRGAAGRPGAQARRILEAVLGELELATAMLGKLRSEACAGAAERESGSDAERRLLRAVFQEVPAPIFLLARDGAIRRINRQAATLLDVDGGSAAGRPFSHFVGQAGRRGVRTQVNAVLRTGRPRSVRCQLLAGTRNVTTTLSLDRLTLPGETGPLVMAVAGPVQPAGHPAGPAESAVRGRNVMVARAIAAVTHRFDLISATARLLLENATFSESLTLRRCAGLFAKELTAWVIVDVAGGGEMRRLSVAGPAGEYYPDLARAVEQQAPLPGSLPWEVHTSGRSQLIAGPADATTLGRASTGIPVTTLLGATSVLCAPLTDGERSYGTVTLARRPEAGTFTASDLKLVEEIGQQLAVAIKVGRMFLRRSAVTDALQASLLPRDLPEVPGMEIAAAFAESSRGPRLGGDFYDVFPIPGGWGVVMGDVGGRGEHAAATSALARHAIRVCAHWNPAPAEVLRLANEVVGGQQGTGQFVTVVVGTFTWRDEKLQVRLASAGHPAPAVVRPDGRILMLAGGGLPLGLFDNARPAAEDLCLEPGDLLVLYTHSATGARAADGACLEGSLGDELAALAGRPAADVIAALRDRVLEFSSGELRDDMTLVALRAVAPPGPAGSNHELRADRPSWK